MNHVLVVGGGLAGSRMCEELRDRGHSGRITLVSAESHQPYDRPPLSKDVLRGTFSSTTLPVDYAELDVDLLLGVRATELRVADHLMVTDAGEIAYDGIAIATGADAVRLPGDGEQLTLRSIEDSLALRERLRPGARVVIVGASWIGAEVATAARDLGCAVTCLEVDRVPLGRTMGVEVGKRLQQWWAGIDLRLATDVTEVVGGAVHLSDGSEVPADLVVSGVGVRPATQWLHSSGLDLDRGVVTDQRLRAAPGVVALGDVAARWSPRYQARLRVQHWDSAASGAAVAVGALLDPDIDEHDAPDPIPYFWSDQFGHKVQYVGWHTLEDSLVWRERADGSWTAFWLDAGTSCLRAALVCDLPRENAQAQTAIARAVPLDREKLSDPSIPVTKATS
ncbi:FAD-dependent oxidoreductase [Sporichthya polymorpha]|uniref:NAD(P)/FAD-dependent oxidoreductase n=1 Tax=Sporichthya polymorpha TaxID=35751 RepID=UPI00052558C0